MVSYFWKVCSRLSIESSSESIMRTRQFSDWAQAPTFLKMNFTHSLPLKCWSVTEISEKVSSSFYLGFPGGNSQPFPGMFFAFPFPNPEIQTFLFSAMNHFHKVTVNTTNHLGSRSQFSWFPENGREFHPETLLARLVYKERAVQDVTYSCYFND